MEASKTMMIVKPDAVERGLVGKIISLAEEKGFKILDLKMLHLSLSNAEVLYRIHKDKPFFESLTRYMASGPCVAVLLEKNDAVGQLREARGSG